MCVCVCVCVFVVCLIVYFWCVLCVQSAKQNKQKTKQKKKIIKNGKIAKKCNIGAWLVGLPLSAMFAFIKFDFGLKGLWMGILIGYIVMDVLLVITYICGWKYVKKRKETQM